MRKLIILLCLSIAIFSITTPAYAYLDPGTGSALLQGLLAGVAGVLAVLKLYWQRIKQFFSWRPKSQNKSTDAEDQA